MHGSLIERTGWLGEDASMVGATWIFLKVTFASYREENLSQNLPTDHLVQLTECACYPEHSQMEMGLPPTGSFQSSVISWDWHIATQTKSWFS